MTKDNFNFKRIFFDLVVVGGWQFKSGNALIVVLQKETALFNISKEKWLPKRLSTLTLYKEKSKYTIDGDLSYYDLELMEFYKFTKKQKKSL